MKRYSAKLLFQFRVVANGESGKRRLCEERIILISASSAARAFEAAQRKGRSNQYHYENILGQMVYFEFIGVIDLLHLGQECEVDEVWYDIQERLLPMERKQELIPSARNLLAIREESEMRERIHPMALARVKKYKPAFLQEKANR